MFSFILFFLGVSEEWLKINENLIKELRDVLTKDKDDEEGEEEAMETNQDEEIDEDMRIYEDDEDGLDKYVFIYFLD